jgi:glycosyltransferase involved in cell wall biosynthesis
MDFDNPPGKPDSHGDDLRNSLGLADGEVLLLQPTRIVARKRIHRAIDLARQLRIPCALVVTHDADDEGLEYQEYLQQYANVMSVRVIFGADWFADERARKPEGGKIYSLADAYQHADLVTYPSSVEGFGNAFLEAIYYRRPLLMSEYEMSKTHIRAKGFDVIDFTESIRRKTVERALLVLTNPTEAEKMVERNYELGRRHYSYSVLRRRLMILIEQTLEQPF